MERTAREILGDEEFENLKEEIMEVFDDGDHVEELVEEIMSSYGLEMDYIFDVIGY